MVLAQSVVANRAVRISIAVGVRRAVVPTRGTVPANAVVAPTARRRAAIVVFAHHAALWLDAFEVGGVAGRARGKRAAAVRRIAVGPARRGALPVCSAVAARVAAVGVCGAHLPTSPLSENEKAAKGSN